MQDPCLRTCATSARRFGFSNFLRARLGAWSVEAGNVEEKEAAVGCELGAVY